MAELQGSESRIARRTLAKGAAWAVPAVAMAAAAPAQAASLVKYPGINGWVNNITRSGSVTGTTCDYTLEVDSTPGGTNTPDGAPFGLYIYDVESPNTFSDAKLTYWIIGAQATGATWATLSGHSPCWGTPVKGTASTQPDGLIYTPYTWTYDTTTCPILSSQYVTDPADGVKRLYLGDFHVRATFTQPAGRFCNNVTFWTQRFITIDRDGAGSEPASVKCFQRRNGTLGFWTPQTVLC